MVCHSIHNIELFLLSLLYSIRWSKLIPISPGTKQIKKKNSMSIELEAANASKDNNVI